MASLLVIDDDPVIRHLIAEILSGAGHEVREAADGRRGLELFRASRPQLVITDILMPEQEGLDVILSLRRYTPIVPIIAISASERYLGYAEKLAADIVLLKPLKLEQLLAAVEALVGYRGDLGSRMIPDRAEALF